MFSLLLNYNRIILRKPKSSHLQSFRFSFESFDKLTSYCFAIATSPPHSERVAETAERFDKEFVSLSPPQCRNRPRHMMLTTKIMDLWLKINERKHPLPFHPATVRLIRDCGGGRGEGCSQAYDKRRSYLY